MKTTRSDLLEIGEEIVCRKGFGGMSFGALADRVGVRKASIHHHFATKADFASALVDRLSRRLQGELEALEVDRRRGCALMRGMIRERREHCGEGAALHPLIAMSDPDALADPTTREGLLTARELLVRQVATILQIGRRDRTIAVAGDIEAEARAILAQVEGAEIAARAAGSSCAFDRALATLESRMSAY